ncbi:oligosaccharide flippase family protein [Erwinia rhapontici]|uniref:oligosaccharide flippase family protein n=1 Tax=Erwinia rhapontici TaxID=55212 RepID=UPI001D0DB32A|nr:oligosaccharide flippase family protein [Erwinia rhapontici]UDQ78795.1 oligosaccharide flippase family protein [Erwinia rhapontici]
MIKRKFFGNFLSLGIMQGLNYLLPILMIPFLVSKIGLSNVGVIATISAVFAYVQLVIDYGFSLTATRNICHNGYEHNDASEITSSVLIIKLLFSLLFSLPILIIYYFNDYVQNNSLIILFTFLIIISQSLFPSWHFQAAEKMHFITLSNAFPKLLAFTLIFLIVKSPEDTWKVQALAFLGTFLSLCISMFFLITKFNFKFKISLPNIKRELKDGFEIFCARLASGLYKNFNVIILGVFTTTVYVGAYSIAERIVRSVQTIQNVAGDVLYPIFSKRKHTSTDFFKYNFYKYLPAIVISYSLGASAIFFMSPSISKLMAKESWEIVNECLKIMSLVFLFGGLNYIIAILGLASSGYSKDFAKCVVMTGVINVFIATLMSIWLGFIGASASLVLSELILLILVSSRAKKTGVL